MNKDENLLTISILKINIKFKKIYSLMNHYFTEAMIQKYNSNEDTSKAFIHILPV